MQLNEAKFEILNYSLNNSLLLRELPFTSQYSCYNLPNGRTIDPAKTVRDLGVLLSNDCSWSSHIQQMAKTARTMTSWVLSVFRDRSRFLMLTLFKTMVRSKLEYCCPVWNPDKISDIELEAIESIQRSTLHSSYQWLPESCRLLGTPADCRNWNYLSKYLPVT